MTITGEHRSKEVPKLFLLEASVLCWLLFLVIEAAKKGMTQVNATYPGAEEHLVPRSYMFDTNAHAAIVIHKTGGDATPEAVLRTFINSASDPDPAKRMRSAHYAVGQDGRIFQFVPEDLGAGANGHADPNHADYDRFWDPYVKTYGNLNLCTLSIEHCDPSVNNDTPLTPVQKEASFKLVAYLVQKYSLPVSHIKPHKSISATGCPGTYPMGELLQFLTGNTIDLTDPVVAGYFGSTPDGQWQCKQTGFIVRKGILSFYCSYGRDAYCGLTYLGLPLSNEIPIVGHPGVVKQAFERGWVCYDPTHVIDFPPGAGDIYLLHLPR